MISSATGHGVRLRGLSEYYMARPENCPPNTVVIGYASVADKDIPELVDALHRAWSSF